MYLSLARLVIVFHAVAVCVLMFGGVMLVAGRFSRLRLAWRLIIITTFTGYVTSQLFLQDCILTRVEKHLRSLGRAGTEYRGSFLDNYFPYLPRIADRRGAEITLLAAVLLLGVVLRVSYLWWNRSTSPGPRQNQAHPQNQRLSGGVPRHD